MKKLISCITLFLSLFLNQATHAAPGDLFNVTASGDAATINITLCLNINAPLSCQNYTVNALTLTILTTAPNHTYPALGIKINTAGYSLGKACIMNLKGYCLFQASDTSSKTITIMKSGSTSYSIGDTLSGLTASGLVLQNNGGDDLTVASDATSFIFSTEIASGSAYNVTVGTQPTGQTCTVTNGSGTATADVTSVVVTCSTDTFSIGGTLSGLTASGLVLQNNGSDDLSVAFDATSFTFSTEINYGSVYSVTIATQPTGQICTVANASGTATSDVTSVVITCTTNTFSIGGTLSGLTASGLVLQNNGSDNLSVASDATTFTFSTEIEYGSAYSVTIATQPTGQSCSVANASGTATADVTNVTITCKTETYSIGGTLSGLTTSGLVLQNNGGDNLTVASDATTFTFSTEIEYGSVYSVTIATQPTGQTCTVTNGSGTTTADVTSVVITCTTDTFSIGGTLSDLTASGLILQNNGSDNLSVASDATSFTFSTEINYGSAYSVTIDTQPTGQTCTVTNGSGTATADVTSVVVTCTTPSTLYAGTGDDSTTEPGSLYTMDVDTGASTFYMNLTNSHDTALASDTTDLYHFTGNPFARTYERINLGDTPSTTHIGTSGAVFWATQGIVYFGSNFIASTNDAQFGTMTFDEARTVLQLTVTSTTANATMRGYACYNSVVYAIDSATNAIYQLDTTTGAITDTYTISLSGFTVESGSALTADPVDGTIYGLLNVSGSTIKRLVTISLSGSTATATDKGAAGDENLIFSSLAFHPITNPTC